MPIADNLSSADDSVAPPTRRSGARRSPSKSIQPHQQRIVGAIYDASQIEGSALGADFRTWAEDVHIRRGDLDRKKKLSRSQLSEALGGDHDSIELERYIFAVERYLLDRAIRTIEKALDVPLEKTRADLPRTLTAGRELSLHVRTLLEAELSRDLELDNTQVGDMIMRSTDGHLNDEFQAEFMTLVPRAVRHAIGSFYTPAWLARHVVREVGYRHEDPASLQRSVCDPACGSGVFLIAAAEEIRQAVVEGGMSPHEGMDLVLSQLHGIDIELVPCMLATASLTVAAKAVGAIGSVPLENVASGIENLDSLDARDGAETFDVIVGNPPWVNWEYMPAEYRDKHGQLWFDLDVFDAKGRTMSFSKEDISALFTAHAIYYRLKSDGDFAFILPESLFKSTRNHRAFRHFELGFEKAPYQVTALEDFVQVKPFEGVANRTVVIYGRNGRETEFPVPVTTWSGFARKIQPLTGTYALQGQADHGFAQRADATDLGSSWSTGSGAALDTHRSLDGKNAYRGRTGLFTGGANAVYHVRPLGKSQEGILRVANVVERAKRPVPQVEVELEDIYVYPFLRGRDVKQWESQVELGALLPHTPETKMAPVAESDLATTSPRLLEYFEGFKDILDERKGFSAWEQTFRETGFYACQRVGDYTFSDWKVVWRYISPTFTSCVLGPIEFAGMPSKPAIPNEKLMLIACDSEEEAYYVGGVLAGSVVVDHVHSRMVSTQISPSIIAGVAVPKFEPSSDAHAEIARICRAGHEAAKGGIAPSAESIARLDALVAALWELDAGVAEAARVRNPF